jgi:hypothetical protein
VTTQLCSFRDSVGKYSRIGQVTSDNTMRPMRMACRITKATSTHSEYVIPITCNAPQRSAIRAYPDLWLLSGPVARTLLGRESGSFTAIRAVLQHDRRRTMALPDGKYVQHESKLHQYQPAAPCCIAYTKIRVFGSDICVSDCLTEAVQHQM